MDSRVTDERRSAGSTALESAYRAHREALFRVCLVLTGDKNMAEDIVHDAFLSAGARIAQLDPEDTRRYLRRVVINAWRSQERRRRFQLRRAHLVRRTDPVDPDESDRLALWSAVLRLPARQRAVVVLRYYEDLPEREIAEVLGCALGTVKSQLSRALDKLREGVER
jgi:RNA polymerase sigma-70 factor (sigma-E family)